MPEVGTGHVNRATAIMVRKVMSRGQHSIDLKGIPVSADYADVAGLYPRDYHMQARLYIIVHLRCQALRS